MEKLYSKVEKNKLLHVINRKSEIVNRKNICEDEQFLQCASLKLDKGTTFNPHKHIETEITHYAYIPQESWVVIQGSVKCILYDVDDSILNEIVLFAGDASFTFYGGHNYLILEDDTIVYEYKTGPYYGQKKDKKFI